MSDDQMTFAEAYRILGNFARRPEAVQRVQVAIEKGMEWERDGAALRAEQARLREQNATQAEEMAAFRARCEAEIRQGLATEQDQLEAERARLEAVRGERVRESAALAQLEAAAAAERAEFRRLADLNATLRAAAERPQPEPPRA